MTIPRFLIFNFFTRKYLELIDNSPFPRRLKSMGSDFVLIMAIFFPLIFLFILPAIILTIIGLSLINSMFLIISLGLLPYAFMLFALINKDFYRGKSIAKRIYGYEIVDVKTNKVASEMQCLIRNSTIIIWPIEVIFSIANTNRRLGDFIAKTKLINAENENPEIILVEIKQGQIGKKYTRLIINSIALIALIISLSFLSTVIQ